MGGWHWLDPLPANVLEVSVDQEVSSAPCFGSAARPGRPPTSRHECPAAAHCCRSLLAPLQVHQLSRLYESAPAYVTDQPPFLNAAALVESSLPPLELLRQLKEVEVGGWQGQGHRGETSSRLGRQKHQPAASSVCMACPHPLACC